MALHEYNDLEQGSEPWLAARRGMVTASVVGQLLTYESPDAMTIPCVACNVQSGPCRSLSSKNQPFIKTAHSPRISAAAELPAVLKPASNDTSRRLTLSLVAERITGETESVYMNDDMLRGHLEEPIAREMYREHFSEGEIVSELGFQVRDDWGFSIGASPDGLVGEHGGLEVKAPRAKTHIATILSGEVPERHIPQIQACLLVSGREWWDFCSYYGGLPPFVKRVYADPKWAESIVDAVAAFEQQAEEMTSNYDLATRGLPATERRIPIEANTVELNIA